MKEKIYDVAIIGGGPAGITAAVYAKRTGLDVVLIEKEKPPWEISKLPMVLITPAKNANPQQSLSILWFNNSPLTSLEKDIIFLLSIFY